MIKIRLTNFAGRSTHPFSRYKGAWFCGEGAALTN